MRNNRRNNAKKERIIMIASSAFVLTALTLTGVYMRSTTEESQDDGYTLDFAQLEDEAQDKSDEIAKNMQAENQVASSDLSGEETVGDALAQGGISEDALDYMPLEVGSDTVEIPGLTDGTQENTELAEAPIDQKTNVSGDAEESVTKVNANNAVTKKSVELHFAEADGLLRPVSGEVVLPFSMDSSVYFSTLDQYKYNPALMISAQEGVQILSCADGVVIDIFENEEIGQAVTIELGDGYQITYGQLQNITISEGQYVEEGEVLGFLAAPTKYFSLEGSNLYLKLTADGIPVNPEVLFR